MSREASVTTGVSVSVALRKCTGRGWGRNSDEEKMYEEVFELLSVIAGTVVVTLAYHQQ